MPPALRNRNFRWWLIGLFVANVGTWMQRVAQEWQVLLLSHHSAAALGLVTGLQFLPTLLIGPIGGVIADRFPKRRVLAWAQVITAVCAVVLGVVVLTGSARLWEIYLFAVVVGVVSAVFQPTSQAFLNELVSRDNVASVVGFAAGSFHVGRLIGPGLAGLIIVAAGTGPVFLVAAATALCLVVVVIRLDPTKLHPAQVVADGGIGMLAEGVRYAIRDRQVLLILGIMAFVGTFAANAQVTNALMATNVFRVGAVQFGLLSSIMAVGSLAGAALSVRRRSITPTFVVYAALAFAGCNVVSGLMPGYVSFAVVMVLVGLAQLTFITSANSLLQLCVDPDMRGRVLALYLVLLTGSTTVGAPTLGWLASTFGVRAAIVTFGVVAMLGTVTVAGFLAPRGKRDVATVSVSDTAAAPAEVG
jgi:MFS family permease